MSVQRAIRPICASGCSALKFASLSSRCCVSATRQFTCALRRDSASKRKLVTASTYRPHTLEQPPPTPPRNSDVPNSSIAGNTVPRFNDIRPPEIAQHLNQEQQQQSTPSISEKEAQKSKPVASPATSNAPNLPGTTTPSKRPRLRPRKAAMNLTPSAVEHLRALLELPDPKLIRVGVKNRGCSGLAYNLEYVDKPGTFDELVEQDGVKVLIDSKALFSIIGSEMDWVEDKLNQRFVFRNPNIKEQCGCGESFMV